MATSFTLGKHYENFIQDPIASGRYATASDVMREGLRLVEEGEQLSAAKLEALRDRSGRLKQGSGRAV